MQRRLFLLLLSSLSYVSQTVANPAAWNCEQSKDGKEWVCSGAAKPVENAPTPKVETPVKSEPVVEQPAAIEVQPIVKKPAPIAEPINPEPVVTPTPVIEKTTIETEISRPIPAITETPLTKAGEWQCNASKGNEWDCQQTKKANLIESGESPITNTAVVAKPESSTGLGLLSPAFDNTQEETFSVLKSQLKVDPWQHCTNPNAPKQLLPRKNKNLQNNAPIDVKSNYSEIFENEISSYFGNVEIKHADQFMSSNSANYDNVAETLDVHGDVYYNDDELAVHTNTATFDLANDQAKLRDVLFIAPTASLRGHAGAAYRDSKTISRYQDVAYTSCPPTNQDWIIHADELKIDKEDGKGTVKNAWLEFKGIPIFYSPYLSFPTESRRTSGFLPPSFGNTQHSGFNFSLPYYWNIAPNYDATFKPRYLTKRGMLLAGEFRYLTELFQGQTNFEVLPNDYLRNNQPRYFASIKNTSHLTDKIHSNIDLNYVSDKNYFAELGSALSLPNFSFLKSQADIGYYGDSVNAIARVENYQSIDKALSGENLPYRKLPQINVNLKHNFDNVPVNMGMDNEFVYFQHTKLLNGQRSNIKPSISLPLQSASAYITPKMAVQYTNYFLSDPLKAGYSSQISRTLPIFSTDSGMTFERNLNFGGDTFLNTLEPRLFYLYIPRTNQNDIPLFDTAAYDIWFNTLFRENRFSGIDRMQDANQITTAITSRLIDEKTGKERMKLSLGEIFYFQNRTVTLPNYPIETHSLSNIIGELSARINDHVAIDSGMQWDPYNSEISRGKAILHLTNRPNEIVNLGYRYRKNVLVPNRANDIIQSDVSFHWPIYDNWSAVGRWQYSLLYNSTQESFFGIEKENCCWRFRVVGRRYVNNLNVLPNQSGVIQQDLPDAQGVSQTGIFFQVELKGLTGMGEKLDTFLEQNIYGYRAPQQ